MENEIIIFTLNGCNHCKNLITKLKTLNIDFIELEITQNRHIWDQVIKQTGFDTLPTVFIKPKNGDDGPAYVPGRDYFDEDEIVEIIKKST